MSNKKAKILIVDDEVECCSLMREYFSAEYDVEIANDGREALSKAEEFQPDCILLDVRMPGMNGVNALASIKVSHPNMKVIMVSASGAVRIAEKCLKMGAVGYILKPVDLGELESTIESALGSAD